MSILRRSPILWILAIIIAVSSAVYQRKTGPTYPVKGSLTIEQSAISFRLLRSETVDKDAKVIVTAPDERITGHVRYRRYKSNDAWTIVTLTRNGETLETTLPHQPPAGKLMYFVEVSLLEKTVSLSGENPIIIRYKGGVPGFILLPHILFMFMAMILSNRAALEALMTSRPAKIYLIWTLALLVPGGLILGPIVQKFAFGDFWTGIPFGHDLTDNKTLIAGIVWMIAWYQNRGERNSSWWIIFASFVMLLIYLIPHSLFGSELDYR